MGLYLRQLLAGRDFAMNDHFASQMANFVYLIGDDQQRVCMVVDPAWDIPGIIDFVGREDLKSVSTLINGDLLPPKAAKVIKMVACEGQSSTTGSSLPT